MIGAAICQRLFDKRLTMADNCVTPREAARQIRDDGLSTTMQGNGGEQMVDVLWLIGVLALLLVPPALLAFRPLSSRWTIAALLLFAIAGMTYAWFFAPWFSWGF